jgi:hypothetical protein
MLWVETLHIAKVVAIGFAGSACFGHDIAYSPAFIQDLAKDPFTAANCIEFVNR